MLFLVGLGYLARLAGRSHNYAGVAEIYALSNFKILRILMGWHVFCHFRLLLHTEEKERSYDPQKFALAILRTYSKFAVPCFLSPASLGTVTGRSLAPRLTNCDR